MPQQPLEEMSAFFNARSPEYEQQHLSHLKGGPESKRSVAAALPAQVAALLDLGIGTGLELEGIFARFPGVQVTGLDISDKMLELLRRKYPGRELVLLQQDYRTYAFPPARFDAVVSCMTMHHHTPQAKTELYRSIRASLRPGGVYVENDYILSEIDMPEAAATEARLFAEYERLRREQRLPPGLAYHFDTPCTLRRQRQMLYDAGFAEVSLVWQREHNITLAARNF